MYLRELVAEDVTDRYLGWLSDPEVTRFLEVRSPSRQEVIDHMASGRATGEHYMYAICSSGDDLHIGNIKIGPISRKHRTSDLSTVIGDNRYWGRGLAAQAIRLGTALAFDDYGARKLAASIYSPNVASVKAYLAAGWVIEAVMRGHCILDGVVVDRICVACFNPEYFDLSRIGYLSIEEALDGSLGSTLAPAPNSTPRQGA